MTFIAWLIYIPLQVLWLPVSIFGTIGGAKMIAGKPILYPQLPEGEVSGIAYMVVSALEI